MKNKYLFLPFFLLLATVPLLAETILGEQEWNFGTLTSRETPVTRELMVFNDGKKAVTVKILPTCNCLTIDPPEQTIESGATVYFRMFYDPFEDSGPVERYYQIFTSEEGSASIRFMVHGYVDVDDDGSGPVEAMHEKLPDAGLIPEDFDLALLYYYESTCPRCRDFIANKFPVLNEELDADLILVRKDMQEGNNTLELKARLDKRGIDTLAVPVLFVGDAVLMGDSEINARLKEEVLNALATGVETNLGAVDISQIDLTEEVTLIASFVAGLLDGVNPCAFATIIMLLTSLALAGKRRKEILIMGTFFTISVYITYFLIGVGLFKIIQAAEKFRLVSEIIRWGLVAVLAVFSVLSLVDYFKIKAGKPEEMTLQLPEMFKRRIKSSIRTYVRSTALIFSSLLLGFLVSLFELGCTGQIYFPIIRNIVRAGGDSSWLGYFFLFIYCVGFIIPLVGVFIATYVGIGSRKVTDFFQKHMAKIKLLMMGLFIAMALMTIFIH